MSDNEQRPNERSAWEGEPAPRAEQGKGESWERDVIARVAMAAVDEQRRARRWGIFFKLMILFYLFLVFYFVRSDRTGDAMLLDGAHTSLVELHGVIASEADANADDVIAGLRAAFESKGAKGVILRINSPGGSPVQAGYINDEIRRLRAKYPAIPLYAVVTDVCASGGYYIAAAADKIYAEKASIVGSIGVTMSGLSTFGFVEAMKKLGIERRILTAGEDKAMLDPFSPLKEDEVAHVRELLGNIHDQFIKVVKEGRGARLRDDPKLFSGFYWTGEQGVELGLVDALGSAGYVAREVIGAEKIVDYTHKPDPFKRLVDRFGVAMGKGVAQSMGLSAEAMGVR